MPQQTVNAIENNFVKGLITEASGINFPENACTETYNCLFNTTGIVERRLGFDYEPDYSTKTIDRSNQAISTYVWKNAAGSGDINLFVAQIGATLYFWNTASSSVSSMPITDTVTLGTYLVAGATGAELVECQFSSSTQYLVVTHPYCEPFYVSYDSATSAITSAQIDVEIRDFEGDTADPYTVDERPTSTVAGLNVHHHYNLLNQGWTSTNLTAWDTTQYSIASATVAAGGSSYVVGDVLTVSGGTGTAATFTVATLSGSAVATVTLTTAGNYSVIPPNPVTTTGGSGSGCKLTLTLAAARTDMPSNSDVMWRFKNTSDAFDVSTVSNIIAGNSPAPKGHYVLSPWTNDRDTASGLSGTTSTTSGVQRPSTSAFFAGRIFYSGVNHPGYNTKIYFTQILERTDQYGSCYQVNDPTSEDLFDLLSSDGGVIKIEEAGVIYKLIAVPGALLIFANNGIWSITGSTGLGFTANDYTVQKISSVGTVSHTSFVDVGGLPAWWNVDGIYIIDMSVGAPSAKNITQTTIKTFYNEIPNTCIANARGYYNPIDGIIQWIYRNTEAADVTEAYTFNRILNFNVLTGAFYPWSLSENAAVSINGIFISNSVSQSLNQYTVVDDTAATVVDDSGDIVLAFDFTASSSISKTFKFLVSHPQASSYYFTFAENNAEDYLDWFTHDAVGLDYTSYFSSGYKIRGEANKKFQPLWVNILSKTDASCSYTFRALWEYSNTSSTNRWSTENTVTHTSTSYDYATKRLKVRGHGKALQFKVSSTTGLPFKIIGWSVLSTINTLP